MPSPEQEDTHEGGVAPGVTPSGEDDSYVSRVARGAGISSAGQGIGSILAYLAQIAVARLFGITAQGFFYAGLAVVNGAQVISRFGLENGVVRYVAHYRTHDDTARVKGTIILSIGVALAISLVISAGMFFAAPLVVGQLPSDRQFPVAILRAFAFVLPFFVFMMMSLWATQGFQTVTYAAYVQHMIRPALFAVLVGVFYLISASAIGVVAAYGTSMLLGGVVGAYFLIKLFPPLVDRHVPTKFEPRSLFEVSVPLAVAQGARYLNTWSAILILTAFSAGAPVAIFTNAARTATFSTKVRFAFSGIFSPIISSFHARGELAELGRLYKDVSRWIFTGAFPIFLVTVVLGRDVLGLFGERVAAEGFTALVIVAVAQLFSASVGTTPRMLAMTGNQNIEMYATATAAAIGLVVGFILIPDFGILGAAICMASAIVTENLGTMAAVKWRIGFLPYAPEWIKPLLAGLIAAVATHLLGMVLPISEWLPEFIPEIIALAARIAVLGMFLGLAFLGVLLLFGLSETDREFLGTFRNVARRYTGR